MPTSTISFFEEDFFARFEMSEGTPICLRTGDSYYMRKRGLAERRFIYLNEERLFEDFDKSDKTVFTIGEIGFGTGLTFLAALKLWKDKKLSHRKKALIFVSTEVHPFSPSDLALTLEPWRSELPIETRELIERYKILVPGLNILPFVEHNVFLAILVGPAEQTLPRCEFLANHWCCDGFSPSKNPSAWNARVLGRISELSLPRATLSSFSAVSSVRHELEGLGWKVTRSAGFAYKAHRTCATFEGKSRVALPRMPHADIIGCGIAGMSIAYFRSLLGGTSALWDLPGLTGSQAPYIYTTPKAHRDFDKMTRFNFISHFFSGTLYRDFANIYGLKIQDGHSEPFDSLNRTHRLFDALVQNNPSLWEAMVQHKEPYRLDYPYAIESSGAEILSLLSTLTESMTERHKLSLAQSLELPHQLSSPILACSWGAQLWGQRYNPSSILRGELSPVGERWSSPTHERHAFNPNPGAEGGFVGFRSQIPTHLPQRDFSPLYTSLHHGSRGFSSGPWCAIEIALSSLGLLQYSERDLEGS